MGVCKTRIIIFFVCLFITTCVYAELNKEIKTLLEHCDSWSLTQAKKHIDECLLIRKYTKKKLFEGVDKKQNSLLHLLFMPRKNSSFDIEKRFYIADYLFQKCVIGKQHLEVMNRKLQTVEDYVDKLPYHDINSDIRLLLNTMRFHD